MLLLYIAAARAMQTIYLRWYVVGIALFLVSLVFITMHLHTKSNVITRDIISPVYPVRRDTTNSDCPPIKYNFKQSTDEANDNIQIKLKLIETARALQLAKSHVRGTTSGDALIHATHALDEILRAFDLDYATVTRRDVQEARSVCKEVYNGTTFGYPFFYKGFELTKCSHDIPEHRLVTVVIQLDKSGRTNLSVLEGIHKYNPNLSVIVGLHSDSGYSKPSLSKFANVILKTYDSGTSMGHVWNDLIESAQTPYVLIARDLVLFTNDSRLHRLIREIERLELFSAGGASRDTNGQWTIGCLQRAYKNHTLVFEAGYHESRHECIFCDHVENSFVISKEEFSKTKFDERLKGEGLFEDFFLRAVGESVICPDSMFYTNKTRTISQLLEWQNFARKYDLKKLKKISSGLELDFGCSGPYACFSGTGYMVTPCCLEELANLVNFIMNACAEVGIICELQEGTLLGAVKFNKVLPWERDADITFLTANYSKFQELRPKFIGAGYSFSDLGAVWCCADNRKAGGKFKINSRHWHAELYGQHLMDSEMLMSDKLPPTTVFFHGHWVNAPRNPGLFARNRYGHEIYAHSQHWLATGKSSGWIHYETNFFTKCHLPGSHNCLDRYNANGNLQFSDPIP